MHLQYMNITLNVSGQHFEINKDSLMKIPYFHDMFDACDTNIDEIIFVNRPSNIFKHVLALIIDPLYPYPKRYAFELDFYGILYNQSKLYDKHQELIDKVNEINNKHQELINIVNNKDDDLKRKIKSTKNRINDIINSINSIPTYYGPRGLRK